MKKNVAFILLLLAISCGSPEKRAQTEELAQVDTLVERMGEDDCIFDQKTQTDAFLKGIDDLKGYSWNQQNKTAMLILQPGDTLRILRGGCDHFEVSANFILTRDVETYTNWKPVYEKVLWIAQLLKSEFNYEAIQQTIADENLRIESEGNGQLIYLNHPDLMAMNYQIWRAVSPERVEIALSYYTN